MPHSLTALEDSFNDSNAVLPGWAMGPSNGQAAGLTARGSWLLEPDNGTGMLLAARDATFLERRDLRAHLRSAGWVLLPADMFCDITSDGTTVIRLLAQLAHEPAERSAVIHSFPVFSVDEPLEASV